MTTPCSRKNTIALLKVLIGDMEENRQLLAPNGWESSPYFAFFHPTAEQQYQAALRFRENLKIFENDPLPTLEEFEDDDEPVKVEAELQEYSGRVLYELLDCHTIVDPSGCLYEIDTGRYCGGLIAQFLNMHYPSDEKEFDYSDFFNVGNIYNYTDPYPVFVLFFRRLKDKGYDLLYNPYRTKIDQETLPREIAAYQEVYGKLPQPYREKEDNS